MDKRYMCRDCKRTFNALTGTPLAQLHRRDAWLDYSVNAKAVGRPVDVHAYADRIVIKQDGVVDVVPGIVDDLAPPEPAGVLGHHPCAHICAGFCARSALCSPFIHTRLGGVRPEKSNVSKGFSGSGGRT